MINYEIRKILKLVKFCLTYPEIIPQTKVYLQNIFTKFHQVKCFKYFYFWTKQS